MQFMKVQIFKYGICNAKFAIEDYLNRHVKANHNELKSLKCKFCGVFFVQRDSLNAHIESDHEVKKPFTCNICKPALQISII